MKNKKTDAPCPCGSGKYIEQCCDPVINGTGNATSAEALMRSRYTAYTLNNEQYLLDSWHSSTRPESVDLDVSIQWLRLKIINCTDDHVKFIATYRVQGKAYKLHENSRFTSENGKWFYVDGEKSS